MVPPPEVMSPQDRALAAFAGIALLAVWLGVSFLVVLLCWLAVRGRRATLTLGPAYWWVSLCLFALGLVFSGWQVASGAVDRVPSWQESVDQERAKRARNEKADAFLENTGWLTGRGAEGAPDRGDFVSFFQTLMFIPMLALTSLRSSLRGR